MSRSLIYSNNVTIDDLDPNVNSDLLEEKLAELSIDNSLFIEPKHEEYAIVLVDASASTKLKFKMGNAVLEKTFEKSVFGKQYELLKHLPHKFFYLLFWSSKQQSGRFESGCSIIRGPVKIESVEILFKSQFERIEDRYLTNTALAFQQLPEEWFKSTKTVYLITDGEMGGGNLNINSVKSELEVALKMFKGNLSILTVERKAYDFNNLQESDHIAGCDVFQTIQNNGLTGFVNRFVTNYPADNDGTDMANFVHINKTVAPLGYIPYGNKYFLEINMDKFVQYIAGELQNKDESEQLNVAQQLSVTLDVLLKNKPAGIVESNIRTFSKLFTVDSQAIYYILGDSLLAQQQGRAEIIADYRRKLNNLYKDAQQKLNRNVSQAIGIGSHFNTEFCSYPVFNPETKVFHILTGPSKMITDTFTYQKNKFPKSCVSKKPIFGLNNRNLTLLNQQCLRQWTRVVYSDRFSVKSNEDTIIYLVLAETLAIYNSSIDNVIKNTFLNLSHVMLKKKRSLIDKTEIEYLLEGNAPSTNNGNFSEFMSSLEFAVSQLKIVGKTIHVWHDILEVLDNIIPGIYDAQKVHCFNHSEFNIQNKIEYPAYNQDIIPTANVYEYTCYITMEDLRQSGGYVFRSHKSPTNIDCSPIFMISDNGMKGLIDHGQMTCPICYSHLTESDYIRAPIYVASKLPDLYSNSQEYEEKKDNIKQNQLIYNCFLIIMHGTVGAGKSTLSNYIQRKYTAKGYNVYNEGTDKYCRTGIASTKAVQYVRRELYKASHNNNKTIAIIDTCGDNRNPRPFGLDFTGWKVIDVWPNYIESNKLGYLAWSLTNVLARDRPTNNSTFYLSPYSKSVMDEGIQLCKDVHKKKAVSLGIWDHSFSKLSDLDRIALALEYAKTIKAVDFDLSNF